MMNAGIAQFNDKLFGPVFVHASVLALGLFASAFSPTAIAANSCESAFTVDARKDFTDSLALFEALERQRMKDPSNYDFEMGDEFKHTPSRMLEELNRLRDLRLDSERESAITEAEKAINEVIKKNVPYGKFLESCELFLDAVTFVKFRNDTFWKRTLPLGRSHVSGAGIFNFSQGSLLIPTFEALPLSKFIGSRVAPIYPIGLTVKIEHADGGEMKPLSFWYHDINHSREMFGNDYRIFRDSKNRFEKVFELNRVMKIMLASIETHEQRRLIKLFAFSWMHENSGKNLFDFLTEPDLKLSGGQAKQFVLRELDLGNEAAFLEAEETFVNWRNEFIKANKSQIRTLRKLIKKRNP